MSYKIEEYCDSVFSVTNIHPSMTMPYKHTLNKTRRTKVEVEEWNGVLPLA